MAKGRSSSRRRPDGATRLGALEELRAVKRELNARHRARKRPPAPYPKARPRAEETTSGEDSSEAGDVELFRREMRGIQRLRDSGRAALEPPKPAPVPRHPPAEPAAAPPADHGRPAPRNDAELFRMMMGDVTPLRDSHRAEPDAPRPRFNPRAEHDKPASENALPSLPEEAEQMSAAELFRYAMRGSKPLNAPDRVKLDPAPPPPTPNKSREDEQAVLRETMETPLTLEDRLDSGEETAFLRTGLPRRVLTDLRRGRWVLQGEVDLHGFTRDEAREALARFLAQSLHRGHRCVRVIHGKGLGSPGKVSILKQLSRGWLAQREEILAFCQAGPNQGGSGALMVLLRGQHRPRA